MQDACNRYRTSYEINLFWQILTGQVEEHVYHYEMKQFARILQYFIKLFSNSSSKSVSTYFHFIIRFEIFIYLSYYGQYPGRISPMLFMSFIPIGQMNVYHF